MMIQLSTVDLGTKEICIPVAEINGYAQGKRLLITAGLDGDEYAGIEAAYKIIEEYANRKFKGHLAVIPILNIPGFEAKQSCNPCDNKFPKYILFPGNKDGSPTEKLMYWLSENYVSSCDAWLDLHGGAIDEQLDPHIWLYETKNERLNELVKKIIRTANVPKIIFEKPNTEASIEALANIGVAYIISEAGYSGDRNEVWIKKHLEIARSVMIALGLINKSPLSFSPRIYRQLDIYKANQSGLWYPFVKKSSLIKKGQKLGKICSLDGAILQTIEAKENGEYLWGKEGLCCRKGDTLIGMGREAVNNSDLD